MKKLLYSIRNFLWYRRVRSISIWDCARIKLMVMDAPRRAATELLLLTHGLRIADSNTLDGIYLTRIQELVVSIAEEQGYAAGPR